MTRPLRERVLSRLIIEPETGCLLWTGAMTRGYGVVGSTGRGTQYVHRLMYEWFVGPIPTGLQIDHLCRVTRCASPAHLEAVTGAENLRRARRPTCIRNHPWDDIYIRPDNGHRMCRACNRIRDRKRPRKTVRRQAKGLFTS